MEQLERRLNELNERCASRLSQTIRSLQAESSIDAQQTLAAYRHRQAAEKHKNNEAKNRNMVASRALGAPDASYFNDSSSKAAPTNPFISQKDFKNLQGLLAKLNQTIEKLSAFQQRSTKLSDVEIVQKKLKQFEEALGLASGEMKRR